MARTRHVFTYKRPVDGQMVEIETDISAVDFERLWSHRRETLQKARYSWPDGRFHWDVDFFKTDEGRTYFAQAEVEMPEDDTDAAAAAGAAGRTPAGLAPAGRPALHLQAAGQPGACREAAGRHPQEGKDRMKIARIDSHSIKVPFTFGGSTGRGPAHLDDATTSCW